MDWILIALAVFAILAFIGCVLQIIWLRVKLKNYSHTQMGASLDAQTATLAALTIPQPTMQVYSLLINIALTNSINNATSAANSLLKPLTAPMTFNVPQICNGKYTSGELSCNVVSYLVFDANDSGSALVTSIEKGSVLYVMLNSVLFLASYNPSFEIMVQNQVPAYNMCHILSLYTITSSQNITVEPNCSASIVPFFGSLSSDTTAKLVSLIGINGSSAGTSMPVHMMAIMLKK
jgi:hypothetical protein